MGFLSKAEGKKKPVEIAAAKKSGVSSAGLREIPEEIRDPGEKEKALRDRVSRIPPGPSAAYTALSLLKAYGSFQAGICFSLGEKGYTNYTSLGLGIEKITLPRDKLYSPSRALKDYFQFSAEEKLELNIMDSDLELWGFPLNKGKPWDAILILGSAGSSSFHPQNISAVLRDIGGALKPRGAAQQAPKKDEALTRDSGGVTPGEALLFPEPWEDKPGTPADLEGILEHYFRMNPSIGGFIIEIPGNHETGEGMGILSSMISHFALVRELPSRRCLALLPESMDRELIAHRLRKNLNTEIPLVFSAGNPAEALHKIEPYR